MAVDVGSAVGYLDLDISKFLSGLKSAQDEAGKTSTTITDKLNTVGTKLTSTGKKMTIGLTTPIVGAGTAAVKTTANFESAMSKVSAISGATGDDLTRLSDKAKEMGAATKFSATESAEAFQYMAMAGWKTEDMLSGISGIMNLAAADGLDLATTSDIVTDALTAFGLKAEDSAHFADVLAKASTNANTNVSMLGESFKYVAPLAGAMGYSVEDVATTLGLMANAGIKGSQAGTALRSALTRMVKPTDKIQEAMDNLGISIINDDGSMKELSEVTDMLREKLIPLTDEQIALNYQMAQTPEKMGDLMEGWNGLSEAEKKYRTELSEGIDIIEAMDEAQLQEAAHTELGIDLDKERTLTTEEYDQLAQRLGQKTLVGLTDSQQAQAAATIFGQEAMSGMLAVITASEEDYNNLSDAINNADGTAKNMADTMNDNLSGQITILKSQLEGVAIQLGEIMLPVIKKVVDKIQKAVDWFSKLSKSTQETIIKIAAIVAVIGPLLVIVGKVITLISTVINVVRTLKTAFTALNAVLAANPIFLIIAAISALIAIFVVLWNKCEWFRNFWKGLWEGIKKVIKPVVDFIVKIFQDAWENIKAVWEFVAPFFKEIWDLIKEIFGPVIDFFKEIFETVWNLIKMIFEPIVDFLSEIWNGIKAIFEPVVDWFREKFETAIAVIKLVWQTISEFFREKWEAIKSIFAPVVDWFRDKFQEAVAKIKLVFSAIGNFFKEQWEKTKAIWNVVGTWFRDKFQEAIDNIKAVFSIIGNFFKERWEDIKSVFSAVGTFFKDKFHEAWENIKAVFSGIKEFFEGIWDKITGVFKSVGTKIADAFSGAFKKVVNSVFEFIEEKINGFIDIINGAIHLINQIPGVDIGDIGHVSLPRLARGGLAYGPTAAIVGDNKNAAIDPEVISPLSKLKEMIAQTIKETFKNIQSNMMIQVVDITPLVTLMEQLVTVSEATRDNVLGLNKSYNLYNENDKKEQSQEPIPSGDTYNFYTDKSIDEEEAARQIKRVKRDIIEGF